MKTSDDTLAALSALLAEANARACRSCGQHAAVRTRVPESALDRRTMLGAPKEVYVWLCFECGHEEPELH